MTLPEDSSRPDPAPLSDLADASARLFPARFMGAVVLTKREVFLALEACATAERGLLRAGRAAEAAGVAALFELLEDRVSGPTSSRTPMPGS